MPDGNPVAPERIQGMFDTISGVYDPMNLAISGFQEPFWRRRVIRVAGLGAGGTAVDVATGTGKVAADLWRSAQPGGRVIGVDFSEGMLEVARDRHRDRPGLSFVHGDALSLPIDDESADVATICFGMRNLHDYAQGFAEMRRVVRPGGRVVCLEVARPTSRIAQVAQAWFDRAVPIIGRLAGQPNAYSYLVASTEDYPDPERVADIMREVGLTPVRWTPMSLGIVTLHVGHRPR